MNAQLQAIATQLKQTHYEEGGNIYHPLPFEEFSDLTTSSDARSAYLKWDLIKNVLTAPSRPSSMQVLDVGANAGFYTFNFANLGARVDAYEPHEHYANIGRQIAAATQLAVSWYNKPLEKADLTGKQYDVALMLSVFQWISQGNENLEEATELLRTVASSSRMLFFELGCNHGKSAIHTSERPIGWIWRLLKQTTTPKQVAYLGATKAWGQAKRHVFVCAEKSVHLTFRQQLMTYALRHGGMR